MTGGSERIAVVAPRGRDAAIALKLLSGAGVSTFAYPSIDGLVNLLRGEAGAAIVTEEVLTESDLGPLLDWVSRQPEWSDFPFLVLMRPRAITPALVTIGERLYAALGNVTFLERPLHPRTLLVAVEAALRSRRRQYEARQRLAALREAQDNLTLALSAGRFGAWTLSVPDMRLVSTAQCKQNYGRDPEEAFDYPTLMQSVHPSDRSRLETAVQKAVTGNERLHIVYGAYAPDGTLQSIEITGRSMTDGRGVVDRLVGVSANITGRVQAEQERERLLRELAEERAVLEERVEHRTADLERANQALLFEMRAKAAAEEQLLQTQKIETMGQLVGGVAHDFNNILMIITANVALLKRRFGSESKALPLLDAAKRGADRGAQLTQRLLAFARRQDLQPESIDPGQLLADMLPLIERSVGPLIQVRITNPAQVVPVLVDPTQFEMAVLNLAINSRDAMTGAGVLAIEVSAKEPSDEQLRAGLPLGRYVSVAVSDSGHGMDAATLAKAIEPFFSTKGVGKGTGLGLSMVHGLARQSNGAFYLTSATGQGTTADLWLPMATQPPTEKVIAETGELRRGAGHVLVVDDDVSVAATTAAMLEEIGYLVTEAHGADQALAILERESDVGFVVTDYAMPGVNGLELADQIARLHPGLPVLLVTGFAEHMGRERFMIPQLIKPFTMEQLSGAMASLGDGHHLNKGAVAIGAADPLPRAEGRSDFPSGTLPEDHPR